MDQHRHGYMMENEEESLRLDLKTDPAVVEKQALWAGIQPGMRVADLGCGSGKTSFVLNKLTGPSGSTVGIDIARQRIDYAQSRYSHAGIEYACRDIRETLTDLGLFDFVWVRFVLEYYRRDSVDILKNISRILKPGGILCLIDLDCNCLRHHGLSPRLEKYISELMKILENEFNFDPYAGIKLYSYMYDLRFQDIEVNVTAHNIIYGELKEIDSFNWTKKVEMAAKNSGCRFSDYQDGYEGFFREFREFFTDHRRFTYNPLICCRGVNPPS